MTQRWIVTAEGTGCLRPFMILEFEQREWTVDIYHNMDPKRWHNRRVWHYTDGGIEDVTAFVAAQEPMRDQTN